jgi:hypothetical protein
MPLPLVVVEVPAQDRGAPETSALIEACTVGLGSGRCELTQAHNAESVSAVAIVSWRDLERLSALVEVGRVRQPSESWRSEELRFKPEDQQVERFRTLGLAIATLFQEASPQLAGSATGTPEAVASARKKLASALLGTPSSRPHATKPALTDDLPSEGHESESSNSQERAGAWSAHRSAEAWISAGAFAAYNPELLAWHGGGQLEFAVGASRFPGFLSALGSYAVGPDLAGVSLSWSTLGLGPGLRLRLAPNFELRGVARGLLVDVSGRASDASRSSRQDVWVPGAGFELELALRAGDRLSATLGTEVQRLAGNVPIREHNQLAGTVGKTALGVTLTLELRLYGERAAADKMPE